MADLENPRWADAAQTQIVCDMPDDGLYTFPAEVGHPDYDALVAAEAVIGDYVPPPPTGEDVNAERDRRYDAGFMFGGVLFQSRPDDRESIAGAANAATVALTLGGKSPGDLRWHDGDSDFVWIAADNSLIPMDAPTVIGFGQTLMARKSALIFASRALKDTEGGIPAGYADDENWPAP